MKLYLREWWAYWKEYDVYNNLATAINERWTQKLYEIDLKDDENICWKSLFEKISYIKKDWKVGWENTEWDNHYTFIVKSWEDIHNMTVEEMVKRVKKFQKRLKKFDEIDKAKHSLELQIKSLQNELDRLNWK